MSRLMVCGLLLVLMVCPLVAQDKVVLAPDVELLPLSATVWQHVTY